MVHSWLHKNRTETPTQSKWHPAESQSRTRQHRSTHQHQRREIKKQKTKKRTKQKYETRETKRKSDHTCAREYREERRRATEETRRRGPRLPRGPPPQNHFDKVRNETSKLWMFFFPFQHRRIYRRKVKKDDNFPRPKLERPSTPRLHVQLSVTARTHTHKKCTLRNE